MRVATKAVKTLAKNAGFPDEYIDRHLEELTNFVFLIAAREQKWCADTVRKWYFDQNPNKARLFELFGEDHDII